MDRLMQDKRILVVGAGQMGAGIAHGFASAGAGVLLFDASPAAGEAALSRIGDILDKAVARGRLAETEARETRDRIRVAGDLGRAAAEASLIVETASEQLAIKTSILEAASAHAAEDCLITSNTSALSITELATVTKRPDRFAGFHFFNPVHRMPLVEVVRGLATSDETVAALCDVARAMDKDPIVVAEAPGFTTSRMSAMMGNEAMYMLESGIASAEDIDKALRLGLGHPMGPLELGDLTGWDTRFAVLQYLHRTLGEKFRPCPLIEKMVKAGRYGRKVGHGVYRYEDGRKVSGSGLSVR